MPSQEKSGGYFVARIVACVICLAWTSAQAGVPSSAAEMSLEEKVAQLIVIPAGALFEHSQRLSVEYLVSRNRVGAVLLKQGTWEGQKPFIDALQKKASIPLLCLQDAESGVAHRLAGALSFPKHLTLGAVQDLSLLYLLGQQIGIQCLSVGAHLNLAPVADVNRDPLNPIIHMRSFGNDPDEVAARCRAIQQGMQSVGLLTCAKHFPGHGNVSVDSHVALPCVRHTRAEWEMWDRIPFEILIDSGVDAVMTAHLSVPALGKEPVTFSPDVVHSLLREEMGFGGLVITDALNMKAVAGLYPPGEIAIRAVLAGHDLLLYGDHVAPLITEILEEQIPQAIDSLIQAVQEERIPESWIDASVNRILEVKRRLSDEVVQVFGDPLVLKQRLFEEAMTVCHGEDYLPLDPAESIVILWGEAPYFLEQFGACSVYSLADLPVFSVLDEYKQVVLVCAGQTQFSVSQEEKRALDRLAMQDKPVIEVILGTPYLMGVIPHFSTCLVGYEQEKEAQIAAARVLLGQIPAKGRLPIR